MTNLLVIKTISYLLCLYSLLPIQSQTHNIEHYRSASYMEETECRKLKICFCFVLGLRGWVWGMELDFGDVGTECI